VSEITDVIVLDQRFGC